jgi:PAS domain S-box-containing protein
MTEYEREEVINHKSTDINIYTNARERTELVERQQKKGVIRNFEVDLQTKTGKPLTALVSIDLVIFNGQELAISTLVDITGRKRAEEAIERSNQQINEILSSIQDEFYSLDPDWNFIYVSNQFAARVGKEPKDFVGKNIWKTFPKHLGTILEENLRVSMEKREIRRFEVGGKYTDIRYRVTVFPSVQGITVLATDITEQKKSEELLKKNKDQLEAIIINAPIGIATTDSNNTILSANESFCNILGFSEDELIKFTFKDFTHPDDLKDSIALMEELKSGRISFFSQEKRYIKKDGTIIYGKIIVNAIRENQKPAFYVAELEDVTERKNMLKELEGYTKNLERLVEERTKQLKNAERLAAIGSTAGMVGHDIRNPLQAMISDAYLLRSELTSMPQCESKEGIKESLDSIEMNIAYVDKIVSDLQDYTRPLKPSFQEVNVKDLIDSILAIAKIPKRTETRIDVDKSFFLITDATYLRRVLTNLILNAVQAIPVEGKLTIEAHKEKDKVIISVKDTGVGIPEKVKPNLFAPLFTTKSKGQGLGLAVVKRLVEGLNGKVSFESEEGKGTKFIIELPSQR